MAADSAGMRARLPSTAASSARVHLAPPRAGVRVGKYPSLTLIFHDSSALLPCLI